MVVKLMHPVALFTNEHLHDSIGGPSMRKFPDAVRLAKRSIKKITLDICQTLSSWKEEFPNVVDHTWYHRNDIEMQRCRDAERVFPLAQTTLGILHLSSQWRDIIHLACKEQMVSSLESQKIV